MSIRVKTQHKYYQCWFITKTDTDKYNVSFLFPTGTKNRS
uniref:Uncharacterized protein n=1 Tax=Arundo donax TaxID=35708 RepID=A0A0A9FXJ6_ARUDO